jgi:hypothetical protein
VGTHIWSKYLRDLAGHGPLRRIGPETGSQEVKIEVRAALGGVCRERVRPVKVGVFSGRETRRGKSQNSRSLDSRKETDF